MGFGLRRGRLLRVVLRLLPRRLLTLLLRLLPGLVLVLLLRLLRLLRYLCLTLLLRLVPSRFLALLRLLPSLLITLLLRLRLLLLLPGLVMVLLLRLLPSGLLSLRLSLLPGLLVALRLSLLPRLLRLLRDLLLALLLLRLLRDLLLALLLRQILGMGLLELDRRCCRSLRGVDMASRVGVMRLGDDRNGRCLARQIPRRLDLSRVLDQCWRLLLCGIAHTGLPIVPRDGWRGVHLLLDIGRGSLGLLIIGLSRLFGHAVVTAVGRSLREGGSRCLGVGSETGRRRHGRVGRGRRHLRVVLIAIRDLGLPWCLGHAAAPRLRCTVGVGIGLDGVAGFLGLRVGDSLEDAGLLKGLLCLSGFDVVGVHVLEPHASAVEGGVGDDLDGGLVLDNGGDAVLGASSCHGVGAHGAHAQGDDADGAADSDTREDVSLAGAVGGAEAVEMALDDVALLTGVVDGGGSQADANDGDAGSQGQGEARHGGRRGGARDEARVVLPLALELLLVHARAFLVIFLEIEGHLAGKSLTPRGASVGPGSSERGLQACKW